MELQYNSPEELLQQLRTSIWRVRVPRMATITPDELRMFGVPHTGRSQYDQGFLKEFIMIGVKVDEIMGYTEKGNLVAFPDPKESELLYRMGIRTLELWVPQYEFSAIKPDVPVEWIIRLDNLMAVLFEQVKWRIADRDIEHRPTNPFEELAQVYGGVFGGPTPGQDESHRVQVVASASQTRYQPYTTNLQQRSQQTQFDALVPPRAWR